LATKQLYTRVQNKHDLEIHWLQANTFIPFKGEIIVYDRETDDKGNTLTTTIGGNTASVIPEGRDTPYSYERFKIGDGIRLPRDLPFAGGADETSITLASDLYAYTAIGKITGASNTNPKKVASKGETLKTVFNAVFGTQQDTQPTITTSNVRLNVDAGTTTSGGGEYGAAVSSTNVTITFTLANSGTANYGYRCGTTKTTDSQTFYYPVTKQSNADIKITLPSGQTAEASMVTTTNMGTDAEGKAIPACVSVSNNVLYCNFNINKQVSIKISLPAGNVTTESQTRYGQVTGEVTLGAAQKEDKLTAGTAITKFLTYLGNDANETSKLSGGNKSNTAGSYTINAGYIPYTYCLSASLPSELPTTSRSQNLPSSITVSGGTDSTYLYIFVPSGKSDISGMTAGGFSVPFTKVSSSKAYAVNNGKQTTYKVFKTEGAVKGDTFSIS
jgi:hypothetical protein